MKFFIKYFFFLFTSITAFSQSISLSVVSTSGEYFRNNDFEISWTIGEVVTESFFDSQTNSIAQGFEQPILKIKETPFISSVFTVYPNPTFGDLHFNFPIESNYTVKCYDALGRLLISDKVYSQNYKLDISFFAEACYMFSILNEDSGERNVVKVLKMD
ncbi:MAG: T9SS type A sorting domain-containing protein [Bacteroidetes bacterium]|nr:T9SS type A sorting domain-containing protein [Bacteroidota bacterium]